MSKRLLSLNPYCENRYHKKSEIPCKSFFKICFVLSLILLLLVLYQDDDYKEQLTHKVDYSIKIDDSKLSLNLLSFLNDKIENKDNSLKNFQFIKGNKQTIY